MNALSFLAVIVAVAVVRLPAPPRAGNGRGLWSEIRAGAAGMWAEPGCRAAVVLIGVAALFVSPFIALVPAEARLLVRHSASVRHLSGLAQARAIARTTGTLVTAQGIGAVIGALALAPLAERLGQRPVVVASLVATPLCLIAYASAGSTVAATVAITLVGVAYIGILSGLSAIVQLRAIPELRGRIVSFFFTALGVIYPVGALIQGPLADRVGLSPTMVGGALAMLGVLGLLAATQPRLVRALQGVAPAPQMEPASVVP